MTSDALTPNQEKFLGAYAEHARVFKAAEIAGVARTQHYAWLKESRVYAKAFDEVKAQAAQALEDEAVRRAVNGVDKPVFYQGEVCGQVTEYSDTLLAMLLKAHIPDRYKERSETTTKIQKHEFSDEAVVLTEMFRVEELQEFDRRLKARQAEKAAQ